MKYMMLIHHDEAALAKAGPELGTDYAAFNQALMKAGGIPGERLHPSSAATSVRVTDEKAEILDGPYADTKEQLAGYFVIEAEDLDAAIEWAKRCPSSRYGVIEIRPIGIPDYGN
ncbi:YciI family protein [Phyllobacterium sp. LjRoot231]|uniref:YciI family protein n=1 Tax=Phyllobacterium sp. LjRoot231 TaxID=3342289 RepID=UPI003ECFB950